MPMGTRGWQMEFKITVTLGYYGDVPGPWSVAILIDSEFKLPPSFFEYFEDGSLRIHGLLEVTGERPTRKVKVLTN